MINNVIRTGEKGCPVVIGLDESLGFVRSISYPLLSILLPFKSIFQKQKRTSSVHMLLCKFDKRCKTRDKLKKDEVLASNLISPDHCGKDWNN